MTAPMLMTQHPTEELLAAFVDDRLDTATRAPVIEHLTSCGECREIVLMSTEFQNEPVPVVHGNFGARRWMAAIGGLAAAAVIGLMVVPPMFDPGVDDLQAASRTLKTRPSDGRLAGFAYNAEPSTMRGGPTEDDDFDAKAKLLRIRLDLEESRVPDPHTLGLTRLLTAEKGAKDVSAAVTSMETAYGKARGENRDSIAIDLGAALIAYANWSNHADQNNARALELSNDVLKRHPKRPEALWNRAIALGALNRTDEAKRAWDEYLKVDSDPNSQWAEEAKRHKALLQPDF